MLLLLILKSGASLGGARPEFMGDSHQDPQPNGLPGKGGATAGFKSKKISGANSPEEQYFRT